MGMSDGKLRHRDVHSRGAAAYFSQGRKSLDTHVRQAKRIRLGALRRHGLDPCPPVGRVKKIRGLEPGPG
jgi:hypothetical protein